MKRLILCWLLILSFDGLAEMDAQISQLEKALARIQQETQFTYQQFVMTQEMRRNETQESLVPLLPNTAESVPVPKHEDMQRLKHEKHERIQQYTADLDRLYTRYKALENEKLLILEKINQLEQNQEEY